MLGFVVIYRYMHTIERYNLAYILFLKLGLQFFERQAPVTTQEPDDGLLRFGDREDIL